MQLFKVDPTMAVRVDAERLRAVTAKLFQAVGVPADDAAIATDHLVRADLRSVESHGVSNMLRSYIAGFREGRLNPTPNWRVISETSAAANIDADRGLGIIVAPKAMDIAIGKAKNTGVGIVTVHNSGHAGMVSYHAMMALAHDMIGACTTCGGSGTLPTFGREGRTGTNPLSFAAPADQEAPFVFDAATTVIAGNQLQLARRLGKPLPPGVVADETGAAIMEPVHPPFDYVRGRMMPLGTTRELGSHKGYGLSCMVEMLGGILAGVQCGSLRGPGDMAHCLIAIDIKAFTPVDQFKRNQDEFLRHLRETPPAEGHDRVVYAGLLEAESERERAANGIPLHPEVIAWFDSITDELKVTPKLGAMMPPMRAR